MISCGVRRELLAALFVAIILACHGAYGVNHHYVVETVVPHTVATPGETAAPENSASDTAFFTYLMSLYILLATVLTLALQGGSFCVVGRSVYRTSGLLRRFMLRRVGLAPPILQVFRV